MYLNKNKEEQVFNLLELPDEVLLYILHLLPLPSLVSCCLVGSHRLYRLTKDGSLWGVFVRVGKGHKPRLWFNDEEEERDQHIAWPAPRLWCSTVQKGHKLYMYGGHTTRDSNTIHHVMSDLYQYDFYTRKWTMLEHQMGGMTEHKCVVYNNCLWFVGGYGGSEYTNHVYKYNPENNVSCLVSTVGRPFSPRSALTVVTHENKLYTFGGWNGFFKQWYNDLHEFNFDTREWKEVVCHGTVPTQRTSHVSVTYKNYMYIFGGFSGEKYLNDLHRFNFDTQTWEEVKTAGVQPAPRSRFCAVVHGNAMYLLGGWNKLSYFSDMFCYNFETNVWSEIKNKGPVPSLSQYACCTFDNVMYMFGGLCARRKQCVNDLYMFRLPDLKQTKDCVMTAE